MSDLSSPGPTRPLAGVRVIEVASWVAGPSAGAIMADLGADVIKIEPPEGDGMRGLLRPVRLEDGSRYDGAFLTSNRGKRSVAIALDSDDGQAVLQRLIASSRVVLTNLLPERQKKFALDPDSVHALRSGLVHATITGYGTDGPEAWRPGFDVTAYFARGSHSQAAIEPGSSLPQPRAAVGDNTTGLALFGAVMSCLWAAEATGESQTTEVSLFHTAAWTMSTELSTVLNDGREPSIRGRHEMITPLSNRYPCGDGRWVVFSMPEERYWPTFCRAVDRDEWLDDERFADARARFANMKIIVDLIDEALSVRGRDEWGRIFDDTGLIWGPAQSLSELAEDPQAHATGLFADVDRGGMAARVVSAPMRMDGRSPAPQADAPAVGEHTDALLAELGIDTDERSRLRAAGAIG